MAGSTLSEELLAKAAVAPREPLFVSPGPPRYLDAE
jgi:hypothetical protein